MRVHILVNCFSQDLLKYSILVFDSIKIGFPSARITVWLGHIESAVASQIKDITQSYEQIHFKCKDDHLHGAWIELLLDTEKEPFYIVDTDVVFWSRFKHNKDTECFFSGRRIPEWCDEVTRTVTRARLHTSLLYFDPVVLRSKIATYRSSIWNSQFTPHVSSLVKPIVVPFKNKAYFYDCCSLLYHAIGGQPFSAEQLDCFDHFNFGTFETEVISRIKDGDKIKNARDYFISHLDAFRGAWRQQELYYANRQIRN